MLWTVSVLHLFFSLHANSSLDMAVGLKVFRCSSMAVSSSEKMLLAYALPAKFLKFLKLMMFVSGYACYIR
jgi:hypothetical protein